MAIVARRSGPLGADFQAGKRGRLGSSVTAASRLAGREDDVSWCSFIYVKGAAFRRFWSQTLRLSAALLRIIVRVMLTAAPWRPELSCVSSCSKPPAGPGYHRVHPGQTTSPGQGRRSQACFRTIGETNRNLVAIELWRFKTLLKKSTVHRAALFFLKHLLTVCEL